MSTHTPIHEVKNVLDLGLKKWPTVNYGKHPAYGGTFGRPGIGRRLAALKAFTPYFADQIKVSMRRKTGWRRPKLDDSQNDSYNSLIKDGIVGFRIPDSEKGELISLMAAPISDLLAAKEQINPGDRAFLDNNKYLDRDQYVGIYNLVDQILDGAGIKSAAGRYMGRGQKISMVNLMTYDAKETHWRDMFEDVEVPDPPTTYWHMDSSRRSNKVLIYLTDVGDENGPFSFVKGSHRLRMGPVEYLIRNANDKSRLDKTDRETRELFHALPGFFQNKCEFGNDLSGDSAEAQNLLESEVKVTSADGDMILFDTDGIHRGGMVREGQRHILQVPLVAG